MTKETLDALLSSMLQTQEGISDLLFLVGKPPLIEAYGKLHPFPIDTPEGVMPAELIEHMADLMMVGSERLVQEFTHNGSCDCSYALENMARFRVNIFRQYGRHAIV